MWGKPIPCLTFMSLNIWVRRMISFPSYTSPFNPGQNLYFPNINITLVWDFRRASAVAVIFPDASFVLWGPRQVNILSFVLLKLWGVKGPKVLINICHSIVIGCSLLLTVHPVAKLGWPTDNAWNLVAQLHVHRGDNVISRKWLLIKGKLPLDAGYFKVRTSHIKCSAYTLYPHIDFAKRTLESAVVLLLLYFGQQLIITTAHMELCKKNQPMCKSVRVMSKSPIVL